MEMLFYFYFFFAAKAAVKLPRGAAALFWPFCVERNKKLLKVPTFPTPSFSQSRTPGEPPLTKKDRHNKHISISLF